MISLDEQITLLHAAHGCQLDANSREAILLSLRRLKRIEELMREPAYDLEIWAAVAPDDSVIACSFDTEQQVNDWAAMSLDVKYRPYCAVRFVPAMSATLLKQVEEEVK